MILLPADNYPVIIHPDIVIPQQMGRIYTISWNRFQETLKKVKQQAISKMRITFKDKARADEKAEHTWEYVSILKRLATP
ncbi:MAG: hypothetical protein WBI57_16745 [Desulfobacterales bacterium]